MTDIRMSGGCMDGTRYLCSKHGFDWVDFLLNGIESDMLLNLEDAMISETVYKILRKKEANGRR